MSKYLNITLSEVVRILSSQLYINFISNIHFKIKGDGIIESIKQEMQTCYEDDSFLEDESS
jgi:hypothetical protein